MPKKRTQTVLKRVYEADSPRRSDLEFLLALTDPSETARLFDFADEVRRRHVGDGILLRGIIEFSNDCDNACAYCGLNRNNASLSRYILDSDTIMACVEAVCEAGLHTVVLQSGDDSALDVEWFADLIRCIRQQFDMAVTLSLGELSYDEYALFKAVGADRYLLKIETTDPALYKALHPGMSFSNRIGCLEQLIDLGYQTGSGNLVGLPGQTVETLAGDILFFKEYDFDMVSVGPFIPHTDTPLAGASTGDLMMTLKTIALTRIVTRDAHIPANTAIGSLCSGDARSRALACGANVVMPAFTPADCRGLYDIYPHRISVVSAADESIASIEKMAQDLNRSMDYTRGDSLKFYQREPAKQ